MPRKMNAAGYALVRQFESCRLTAYPDPGTGGEPYTIGFGHTLGVKPGQTICQAEADELLIEDVEEFENGINALLADARTSDNQFSAMTSLAFNIGLKNFAGSTVLKRHLAGNYLGASRAFLLWNKANGKPMAGLMRRREAEAKLYLS